WGAGHRAPTLESTSLGKKLRAAIVDARRHAEAVEFDFMEPLTPRGGLSTSWESCGGTNRGDGPGLTACEAELLMTRDMTRTSNSIRKGTATARAGIRAFLDTSATGSAKAATTMTRGWFCARHCGGLSRSSRVSGRA